MRRVAQVLGKTAVCAVARAAPAPLAPASRAAMAVAPVRLPRVSLHSWPTPLDGFDSGGSRSRGDRARVRADASAPVLLAARARSARRPRDSATPLDATRLEPRFLPGENTANGPLS